MQNKNAGPPKMALWILKVLSITPNRSMLVGDLEELFFQILEKMGRTFAVKWYWKQTIKSIPYLIKNILYWGYIMLKNYAKITYRNFLKQKGYSFINLLGLAVGMTVCVLILFYVNHELSYDKFHKNYDNIYRLCSKYKVKERIRENPSISGGIAPKLTESLPEIKAYTRIADIQRHTIQNIVKCNNKLFEEKGMLVADSNFFSFFSFNMLSGNPEICLNQPGAVVINQSTANKLFGTENPIGKRIEVDHVSLRFKEFTVTGIVEDPPKNSHFFFNYIFGIPSGSDWFQRNTTSWDVSRTMFYSYVLLDIKTNLDEITNKSMELYLANRVDQRGNSTEDKIYYQKMTDIHLHSNLDRELETNSDIKVIYSLSLFALFILVIVCINFMNLMTARSTKRALEVGMRKVLGATKNQLRKQFLTESIIFSIIGFLISIILICVLLPSFNNLTGLELSTDNILNSKIILSVFFIVVITGIFAGSYPAMFLSSFKPVITLSGNHSKSKRNIFLGKVLIIFQFSVSMILISGTQIFHNQLNYMKEKDLGFAKEQNLVVKIKNKENFKKRNLIKESFFTNSNITDATCTSCIPGGKINLLYAQPQGYEDNDRLLMKIMTVDHNFLDMYDIKLISGRGFIKSNPSDVKTCIINETAANILGWGKNATEKYIISEYHNGEKLSVIGVVKDFHHHSLKEKIQPLMIYLFPYNNYDYPTFVTMKINTADLSNSIKFLEEKMYKFEPGYEFEYFFLDEQFDKQYRKEELISSIFTYISIISIFFACLGLVGLAAYMAEQNKKEISIRKVLGASVKGLVYKLSHGFLTNVLIANLIAFPITYYLIENFYLIDFPYRINISLWTFILTGLLSSLLVFLSVGYFSYQAATTNPIQNLKID